MWLLSTQDDYSIDTFNDRLCTCVSVNTEGAILGLDCGVYSSMIPPFQVQSNFLMYP